jgi:hypothetical protein
MTRAKRAVAVGAASLAFGCLLTSLACGESTNDGQTQSPIEQATVSVRSTSTLSPAELKQEQDKDAAKPRFEGGLAGLQLYSPDAWWASGGSACASQSTEAPFLNAAFFGLHQENAPQFTLVNKAVSAPGVCKSEGVTALSYSSDTASFMLIGGAQGWMIDAPADRVSVRDVNGRQAVIIAPVAPGQTRDAELLMPTNFGVLAIYAIYSEDEAIAVAEALNPDGITFPQVKDIFSGTLNGVRFYNDLDQAALAKEDCPFDPYTLPTGVQSTPFADSRLQIVPSYLPAGATVGQITTKDCGSKDVTYANINYTGGFLITRFSGEPAWYSMASDDWYTAMTVAGRPAVLIAEPDWSGVNTFKTLIVVEEFGATVLQASTSVDELVHVAEGLNR